MPINDQVAFNASAVTPSDTVEAGGSALYVGGTGNVTVNMQNGGNAVTFAAVPAGTILPIAFSRVRATLTTATLMVRLH